MPRFWSHKRERQFEHIRNGLEERGESRNLAEEIAAESSTRNEPETAKPRHRATRQFKTFHPAGEEGFDRIGDRVAGPSSSCTKKPARRESTDDRQ